MLQGNIILGWFGGLIAYGLIALGNHFGYPTSPAYASALPAVCAMGLAHGCDLVQAWIKNRGISK